MSIAFHCQSACLAILAQLSEVRTGDFVFPGQRLGKPLSPCAMAKVMSFLGVAGVTIHGFRSAFRDWCGNETHFHREIAEQALAHRLGDARQNLPTSAATSSKSAVRSWTLGRRSASRSPATMF